MNGDYTISGESILLNVSLVLTLIRLVVSPLMLPFMITWFLPFNHLGINFLVMLFFVLLSLTDFLDGYIARAYNFKTVLGALLDPVADKFLLISSLISLLAIHKVYFYPVIVFIAREFFVTGLRLVACTYGKQISVLFLARLKTTFQVTYIAWVILNPYQSFGWQAIFFNGVEYALLVIALTLSICSAWLYYRKFLVSCGDQLL